MLALFEEGGCISVVSDINFSFKLGDKIVRWKTAVEVKIFGLFIVTFHTGAVVSTRAHWSHKFAK